MQTTMTREFVESFAKAEGRNLRSRHDRGIVVEDILAELIKYGALKSVDIDHAWEQARKLAAEDLGEAA